MLRDRRAADLAPGGYQAVRGAEEACLPRTGQASTEQNGQRTRTVYAITPEGSQALAAWLHDPSDAPVIEFEQLVKVFFAENGSRADALATLRAAQEWTRARLRREPRRQRTLRRG